MDNNSLAPFDSQLKHGVAMMLCLWSVDATSHRLSVSKTLGAAGEDDGETVKDPCTYEPDLILYNLSLAVCEWFTHGSRHNAGLILMEVKLTSPSFDTKQKLHSVSWYSQSLLLMIGGNPSVVLMDIEEDYTGGNLNYCRSDTL